MAELAWGARVSAAFRARVAEICAGLAIDDSDLMACMALETANTFSASIRNSFGFGGVGLLQFMPQTATALGTTIEALSRMTPEEQLQFVADYFHPWNGRLHDLGDIYGAVVWPGMIGKPPSYVVFSETDRHSAARYLENAGLDVHRDGLITRSEAIARVRARLFEGLKPHNVWSEV